MSKFLADLSPREVSRLLPLGSPSIEESARVYMVEHRDHLAGDADNAIDRHGFRQCVEAYLWSLLRYEPLVIGQSLLRFAYRGDALIAAGRATEAGREICAVLLAADPEACHAFGV